MLNRRYIANPHLLGENRLPTRTLLVPAQKRNVTHKNFTVSDRIQLLSGMWKFSYLAQDTAEEFFAPQQDDSAQGSTQDSTQAAAQEE